MFISVVSISVCYFFFFIGWRSDVLLESCDQTLTSSGKIATKKLNSNACSSNKYYTQHKYLPFKTVTTATTTATFTHDTTLKLPTNRQLKWFSLYLKLRDFPYFYIFLIWFNLKNLKYTQCIIISCLKLIKYDVNF